MLGEVDYLLFLNFALIASRVFQVHSHKLITHLRRKLAVIQLTECCLLVCAQVGEVVQFVFEFLFVVELTVELSALELCTFVPSV